MSISDTESSKGQRRVLNSTESSFTVLPEGELKVVELAVESRILSVNDDDNTFRVALLIHTLYRDEDMVETNMTDKFVRVQGSGYEKQINFVLMRAVDTMVSDQFHKVVRINQFHVSRLVWTSFYTTATISESFHLESFPFDRHILSIVLQSPDVKLVPWKHRKLLAEFRKINGLLDGVDSQGDAPYIVSGSLKKFKIKGLSVSFTPVVSLSKTVNDAEFVVNIRVERASYYYFDNYTLFVCLIGFANSALIAVPPDLIAGRNGVTITLILSLIAFKYTLKVDSPKIAHSTYMDLYLLMAFLYLIVMLIINILLSTRLICRYFGDTFECTDATLADEKNINTSMIDFSVQLVMLCFWTVGNMFVFYFFKNPEKVRHSWETVMYLKDKNAQESAFATSQANSTIHDVLNPKQPDNAGTSN